jgi:hypothetical protein
VQKSRRAETGSGSGRGSGSCACPGGTGCSGSTGRSGDKVKKVSIVTKKELAEQRCSAGFFAEGSDRSGVFEAVSPAEKIWTTGARRIMGQRNILSITESHARPG